MEYNIVQMTTAATLKSAHTGPLFFNHLSAQNKLNFLNAFCYIDFKGIDCFRFILIDLLFKIPLKKVVQRRYIT